MALDLGDPYWHCQITLVVPRFLALQVGHLVVQFQVLPFGFSIAPWVFTKLTKVVANCFKDEGTQASFYLTDWLVLAQYCDDTHSKVRCTMDIS